MLETQEEIESYILTFIDQLSRKYARLKLTEQEADAVYDKEIICKFLPEMRSMGVMDLPMIVSHAIENIIYSEKV